MSDIHQGSGMGIIVAAVVGAAVGAGVALLFAPCSGRETRGWLAHRSREIKDKTTSAFERAKEATRRAAKEIGSVAGEAANAQDRPAYTAAGATTIRS
jgi:gas vesicle protein